MALLTNFVYRAYISLRFRLQSVNLLCGEECKTPKISAWTVIEGMIFFLEELIPQEFLQEKEHDSVTGVKAFII